MTILRSRAATDHDSSDATERGVPLEATANALRQTRGAAAQNAVATRATGVHTDDKRDHCDFRLRRFFSSGRPLRLSNAAVPRNKN